jgi:hypothetical protein
MSTGTISARALRMTNRHGGAAPRRYRNPNPSMAALADNKTTTTTPSFFMSVNIFEDQVVEH